jgi:hypothetical protein
MGSAVDYAARAAECRRLATLYTRPEHWGHFFGKAATWEILLKYQQETSRGRQLLWQIGFRRFYFFRISWRKGQQKTITTK